LRSYWALSLKPKAFIVLIWPLHFGVGNFPRVVHGRAVGRLPKGAIGSHGSSVSGPAGVAFRGEACLSNLKVQPWFPYTSPALFSMTIGYQQASGCLPLHSGSLCDERCGARPTGSLRNRFGSLWRLRPLITTAELGFCLLSSKSQTLGGFSAWAGVVELSASPRRWRLAAVRSAC
jgi:hypothetical protein